MEPDSVTTHKKLDFEQFKLGSKSKAEFPRATINKAGNISFNKRFMDEYFKKKIEGWHVVFHYDINEKIIGLQVVSNPNTFSNPLRMLEKKKGMVVSARAFLKHFKIAYDEPRSYEIELYKKVDSLPFFIIDLKKGDRLKKREKES